MFGNYKILRQGHKVTIFTAVFLALFQYIIPFRLEDKRGEGTLGNHLLHKVKNLPSDKFKCKEILKEIFNSGESLRKKYHFRLYL